jgi:hypothetical protein
MFASGMKLPYSRKRRLNSDSFPAALTFGLVALTAEGKRAGRVSLCRVTHELTSVTPHALRLPQIFT